MTAPRRCRSSSTRGHLVRCECATFFGGPPCERDALVADILIVRWIPPSARQAVREYMAAYGGTPDDHLSDARLADVLRVHTECYVRMIADDDSHWAEPIPHRICIACGDPYFHPTSRTLRCPACRKE